MFDRPYSPNFIRGRIEAAEIAAIRGTSLISRVETAQARLASSCESNSEHNAGIVHAEIAENSGASRNKRTAYAHAVFTKSYCLNYDLIGIALDESASKRVTSKTASVAKDHAVFPISYCLNSCILGREELDIDARKGQLMKLNFANDHRVPAKSTGLNCVILLSEAEDVACKRGLSQ